MSAEKTLFVFSVRFRTVKLLATSCGVAGVIISVDEDDDSNKSVDNERTSVR
jgi:hypothetical protein